MTDNNIELTYISYIQYPRKIRTNEYVRKDIIKIHFKPVSIVVQNGSAWERFDIRNAWLVEIPFTYIMQTFPDR